MPHLTAIVTVLAVLFYAYTGVAVAIARGKYKIAPPATTGHPDFERVFRVQMNTLEWMPIFLPLLWLCAFYIGDAWAAGLGLVWILGRALYSAGYTAAADKREWGFRMQASACAVLLIADIVAIGARLFQGH